jgi:hypothetical protein
MVQILDRRARGRGQGNRPQRNGNGPDYLGFYCCFSNPNFQVGLFPVRLVVARKKKSHQCIMFNLFGENLKFFDFKKLKYTMFQTYCSNILLPPLPLPARAFTFKHTSKVAANVNNHRSHMDARSICHTAGLASKMSKFPYGWISLLTRMDI